MSNGFEVIPHLIKIVEVVCVRVFLPDSGKYPYVLREILDYISASFHIFDCLHLFFISLAVLLHPSPAVNKRQWQPYISKYP